ncbi:MAG: hypothetical protein KME38_01255 [Spirirestis rafaelensis WJT71-NPBG6]|jgi:hypothetical protein|nr:hypothetical protein [Spirirestis rafaelensis WJT71-NPBG6]
MRILANGKAKASSHQGALCFAYLHQNQINAFYELAHRRYYEFLRNWD